MRSSSRSNMPIKRNVCEDKLVTFISMEYIGAITVFYQCTKSQVKKKLALKGFPGFA